MRLFPILFLASSHMLLCDTNYLLLFSDRFEVVLRVLVAIKRPLILILWWKIHMMRGSWGSARWTQQYLNLSLDSSWRVVVDLSGRDFCDVSMTCVTFHFSNWWGAWLFGLSFDG